MANESPKGFLKSVKGGIGESVLEGGIERIAFQDDCGSACSLECRDGGEALWVRFPAFVRLTPGQAKRLANTLERWAIANNFGKSE